MARCYSGINCLLNQMVYRVGAALAQGSVRVCEQYIAKVIHA